MCWLQTQCDTIWEISVRCQLSSNTIIPRDCAKQWSLYENYLSIIMYRHMSTSHLSYSIIIDHQCLTLKISQPWLRPRSFNSSSLKMFIFQVSAVASLNQSQLSINNMNQSQGSISLNNNMMRHTEHNNNVIKSVDTPPPRPAPAHNLPGHMITPQYQPSPVLGYKTINTSMISSASPMSMSSLHNGLPPTNNMMSSSSTTSSSSSPRQANGYPPDSATKTNGYPGQETLQTNGYHHDLPSTGLTSLPSYNPVYNNNQHHSLVNNNNDNAQARHFR